MTSTRLFASIVIALSVNACGSSGSGGVAATGGGGGNASPGSGGALAGAAGATTATGGAGGQATGGTPAGGTGGAGGITGLGGAGAAAACGDSTGPSSGDGCNTLTTGTVCVQEMMGNGAPPAANGGTIMEGTYDLMSRKLYAAADGAAVSLSSERNTIMISSVTAAAFVLDTLDESGTQVTHSHGPVTMTGSSLTYAPTCPTSGGDQGGTVSFTATGATLTIIQTSAQGTTVSVYIKH